DAERERADRRLAGRDRRPGRPRSRDGDRRPHARRQVRRADAQGGARDGGVLRRRSRLAPKPGAPPGTAPRGRCRRGGARPDLRAVRPRPRRRVAARDGAVDPGRDRRRPEPARGRQAPALEGTNPRGGGGMTEKVRKSEAEWKAELDSDRYAILREAATEAPWSGDLLVNHEDGSYRCGACNAELFRSDAKFESGSGWPSFFQPVS